MDIFDELFDFSGAKIALFCEGKILTSLRDDFPDLPYAGFWDLPGGDYVIIMTGANYLDLSRG
ncbi:MutT/NUDIX family protein [Streptococcus agalactiae ATCC 13813]|uniref:MutT/nudix family protein 7,8-dihydro-8 -oxoguanine-triphosphatase n=1 Tax=Streptococcus agalactiae TaxID=1311 RepID=A0A7Z7P4Y3_STRAG|nr:MutT/NUDIX family protein [Streptococcus agalactiae ATCC 13813]MBY4836129.1 7,8-dihydro-8-oxoguanine-triphosphatase [Streptococcus agalactiae]MBY5054275.1 7,8-dihydro-8-oxoguanine-triphosphatase [Streptococcus agalactiae]PHU31401.1 7,8-dihydro-8-oxoguanine-triphosphatase [Streptococcus agalactiae]SQA18207.1 MutT/nudix family protein; 7,8-dihydro-8 -oxoguanine-triphosphatase [Streptococcus agalactiae]